MFANAKIPASCQYEGSELDGNLAINPSTCVQLVPMRLVFIWLSKIANVLVALAAGSAIAGAISCLATPPRQPEGTSALAKDQLQRLNQYVYLGAALMVSGMISMLSWLHWPDFYVSGNTKDSYSSLVSGLTIYFGINYSLIIFAYYAPVALILAQRAAEPTTPARPAKATATPGTLNGVSASETLKVIFALLSPFLTGLLGTLINMLSKGLGGQ